MSTASKASGASRSAGTQKHTPGSWHLNRAIRGKLYVEADGPVLICDMQLEACVDSTRGITEADARLIASAPELLEFAALVARMRTLDEFGDGDDAPQQDDWIETLGELIASARPLVAKATGATVVAGAQP